jgi:RNA polymerase sigma factor (sigma-70 family)
MIDALRRRRARKRDAAFVALLDADGASHAGTPESELLAREGLRLEVKAWKRSLRSRKSFEVVCLRMIAGLTSREAAQLLGTKAATIDSRLHRARHRLHGHGFQIPRAA